MKSVDEFIKELLQESQDKVTGEIFNKYFVPYLEKNSIGTQTGGAATIDNKGFNKMYGNQKKDLYFENSRSKNGEIYTSPNTPVMYPAPKRPIEDVIVPKVKDLTEWLKNEPDILLNKKTDYSKPMNPHEKVTDYLIKNAGKVVYPVSSDMYTDGMTDFSRAKQNPNAKVININDVEDKNLKDKINQYGAKPNERGVHYDTKSEASKLFSNSPEVKEFYKKNKDAIKRGEIKEHNFNFDAGGKDIWLTTENVDRYTSVQHGTLTDMNIDNKGRGTGKLIDRSDYDYRKLKDNKDLKAAINNHGYNMQEKGNYENYFSIIDILSDENNPIEINNLLEKLKKYLR